MGAENGNGQGKTVPILITVPANAIAPRFAVTAQWQTGVGIHCPPRQVAARALEPEHVVKMFVHLVNSGRIGVVTEVEGENVVVDFPPLQLALMDPPPAPATEPPAPGNRIIVPE